MISSPVTEKEAYHIAKAVADYVWQKPLAAAEHADLTRVILEVETAPDFDEYAEKIARSIDEWKIDQLEAVE